VEIDLINNDDDWTGGRFTLFDDVSVQ
jgi:hypothetical protein